MTLGPHAAFIWMSYATVGLGLGAIIAWLIVDGRRQRAALDDLEARGVGRRAKSVNARPTAEKVPEA